MNKRAIKDLLGEIPLTVELYWLLRQRSRQPVGRFQLKHLRAALPEICAALKPIVPATPTGKQVFLFATLHYWIEYAALLGLTLAGQGHRVTLGYLPYGDWEKPISRFDLRAQNMYARQILQEASPYIRPLSLLDIHPIGKKLPADLAERIDQVTLFDVQYTLQVEDVDRKHPVYQLRKQRNDEAALAAWVWLASHRPDVVIVPNGTIQELGVIYQVAAYLNIRVVTYEFGDQRERIWLAQDGQVMRQETDKMWESRRHLPISDAQMDRLRALFAARQKATLWENFARLWQGVPARGGEEVRAMVGLDQRPVVLLATNVLGDSLTLGRQVFSRNMAEWITRTVQYFAERTDVQLVVRIHPGEALTHGTSMVEVVQQALPQLPPHIHLILPKAEVNTYDLVDVADLGLVYTTTVGMEMAMNGVPVVVAGQTHYRGRGFTYDPASWDAYFDQIQRLLRDPAHARLGRDQVALAWQYAYRFFFEFPRPFPWHLVRVWDDYKARPMAYVLGEEGSQRYRETFRYLTGDEMDWSQIE